MQPNYRLLLSLAVLGLPTITVAVASPSAATQAQTQTRSFIVLGPSADADLKRLREALEKVDGVEQVELVRRTGGVSLRIRGDVRPALLSAAAMSIGFDLLQPPMRTYIATGPSSDEDIKRLRDALGKAAESVQIQLERRTGGATLRIRGDVKGAVLTSAAKSAGFEMWRESYYVASGSSSETDYKRLREALGKVAGVEKVELHEVAGGASLLIKGDMEDDVLLAGAKSAGFAMRTIGSPVTSRQFTIQGAAGTEDDEKLQQALKGVSGIGAFQIRKTPNGTRLDIPGGTATADTIVAAAKAAGFDVRQVEAAATASDGANEERVTPPAPGERIVDGLTKVGDLAPNFTLITKDGKSKISLTDYRGKKPVVLIFGSYT